jgi:hypothetical protein
MPGASLAFPARVRNNPLVTIMRFAFTVMLALSLFSWEMNSRGQEVTDSAKASEQAPGAPPGASVPDSGAPAEKKAPESDAGQKAPEPNTEGKTAPDSATTDSAKTDSTNSNTKPDSTQTDSTKTDPAKTDSTKPGSSSGAASSAETRSGVTKRPSRTSSAPPAVPRKVVVRQGGAKEPATQIAPGMTPAEAARERQNAEQWLRSTGDQLPQLEVLPDVHQQETVVQIRNYMDGARSALQEGDVRRASTLAEKAHLLAEDLLKR